MNFFRFKKYLNYRLHAHYRKGHWVHSPFVYHLITDVIEGNYPFYCFDEIELMREGLKSKVSRNCQPAKYAQMFFRMINFFQPGYVVEFGQGDGITAQYLEQASKKAKSVYMDTVENEAQVHRFLQSCRPDFVIFYENLSAEALQFAMTESLAAYKENSVFLIAGIHENVEKEENWQKLLQCEAVTLSLDLCHWGIILFNTSLERRNYTLAF